MILLNTTFCVPATLKQQFLEWVGSHYITRIKNAGHSDIKLLDIPAPDPDSCTFGVQFCIIAISQAEDWRDNVIPDSINTSWHHGKESLLHFTTLMNIL